MNKMLFVSLVPYENVIIMSFMYDKVSTSLSYHFMVFKKFAKKEKDKKWWHKSETIDKKNICINDFSSTCYDREYNPGFLENCNPDVYLVRLLL